MREEERKEIFTELLKKYEKRIFNLVYYRVGNVEDAMDLTQDIFFKVYKNLHRFRGESTYLTWIYKIALNHTSTYLKRKKLFNLLPIHTLDENKLTYEEKVEEGEKRKELVREKIMHLKEPLRDVLVLFYIDGRSIDEISEILNIPVGTVKSRLKRGRDTLIRWLGGKDEV